MNEFDFKKLSMYKDNAIIALQEFKDNFSLTRPAYNLFLKKFTKQLEKVTVLTFKHETEIIEHYQYLFDFLPKDLKREMKKKIRLHFRN